MKRFSAILCTLCCVILVMPQGWCCWLIPLECCQVAKSGCEAQAKPQKSNCCCQTAPVPDDTTPAPLPVKCAKCIHDTTKPSPDVSSDIVLAFAYYLPLQADINESIFLSERLARLPGDSPPLHVQLCVWRC